MECSLAFVSWRSWVAGPKGNATSTVFHFQRALRVQIYGAVLLNNTMCLGLFLLVVHAKHLRWTYTSEVFVTVGTSPH